jgi:hypothetical protein
MTKKETLKLAELVYRAAGALLQEHCATCDKCLTVLDGVALVALNCEVGLTLERVNGLAIDHRYALEFAAQSLTDAEMEVIG